jgi:hypothetical protein
MQVIIGVDPHKASHTAVAIDSSEVELGSKKVRASRAQVEQLLDWAAPFPARLWAVEGAEGMGYLLAQQLVASGEHVCNVPATLAARARVLGTGRSNKNDPNDALSVAIAALRTPGLRPVERASHGEVLRLLAKRNTDIGVSRKRVVCRIHALLVDLDPGGIAKESTHLTSIASSPASASRHRRHRSATTWSPSCWPRCAASTNSSRHPTNGSAMPLPPPAPPSPTSTASAPYSPPC